MDHDPIADLGAMFRAALRDPDRLVDEDVVARGIVGMTDAKGKPLLDEVELRNPIGLLTTHRYLTYLRGLHLLPEAERAEVVLEPRLRALDARLAKLEQAVRKTPRRK